MHPGKEPESSSGSRSKSQLERRPAVLPYDLRDPERKTLYQTTKKKREAEKGKADLTTVLHIRELPHLHMKLAV